MSKGRGSHRPPRRQASTQPVGVRSDAPLQAVLDQALACHRSGQLEAARGLYQHVLRAQPRHFDALHLLGMIEHARGDPGRAAELIGRATQVDPRNPYAFLNLGNACSDLGQTERALTSYERALALQPDLAEAVNNRANALKRLRRYEEALAGYERLLKLRPGLSDAFYNRGNVLRELGRPEEALASYERALALRPDDAEALNNRGAVLHDLKRYEEALASYERALALKPDYAQAQSNRGNALRQLGRMDEALASYELALARRPDFAEALNNRATCLAALKRYAEAAEAFSQLSRVAPDYPYAPGNSLHARLHCCDWSRYAEDVQQIRDAVRNGRPAATPFSFLAMSESAADQHRCACLFAQERFPAAPALWRGERYQHERIRLAYLSADFHDHATAYLIAELLEIHDRARFETFAFSFGRDDAGPMRRRVEQAFDHFFDVRHNNDRQVAEMLRTHEIDIAIDLKGYTQDGRPGILAHRAAPLQVSYLGYPGTLGADYIDYIVADAQLVPPGHEAFYSEQVVRLPGSYQVNDSRRPIAARTPARTELGLPESGPVFCCFNNSYKITPPVFDIWMRLLDRVGGSVLWLLEDSAVAANNLRREAERRGIAAERLIFAPRMTLPEHLARQRAADLFLDTWPYNAHTTASDALWAGLPVLTRMGETFAGRVAASLLRAIGLPELITNDAAEYEARALELASAPALLGEIRLKLERNRATCPLFDTARFRRAIETAYVCMWERSQRGEAPAGFAVP